LQRVEERLRKASVEGLNLQSEATRDMPWLRRFAVARRSLPGLLGGIGWRLLVRVLFFSSAITLLLTLAQLYVDYRRDVSILDQRMSEIDSGYRQSLGEGLWRLDARQLQLQVEGILRLPDIRFVELREATDRADPLVVTAGSRQSDPPARRDFKIFHTNQGAEQLLGILKVEATFDGIYRNLLDTAATIMVSQAIKTFVVSFFILFIVHRLITRHLVAIATSLRQYDLLGSHGPLRLERHPPKAADELDHLVGAFDQMYARLQAAYNELQLQVGLLQRLPVSAWTLKPDGTPDFVNQVWLEFSGQDLDFVRSGPEAWMTAVHPEDRGAALKGFWDAVRSGQGFSFETRNLRAEDGTYRRQLQQAVVLRDAEGKVLKFVGTSTDIDDQKRAEEALRQAQSELARINRVTTMGELAASLAHEVNQPITGAIINANVCLRKLEQDEPDFDGLRAAVARMMRDTQRAADVISRIRSQFKGTTVSREIVDINNIIQETVPVLRDEVIRYNISVRTELAAFLPPIIGDRVQLQQVMMNLIVNAMEAMKDVDGTRDVILKSQRTEEGQILVSVSDTGIGFPQEMAERLFAPFFTTKPDGTGMGLRICRSIVEAHDGRLWAMSSLGHGATFHFSLPAGSGEPRPPQHGPH
jgi:PAS domain S-box-containing protein